MLLYYKHTYILLPYSLFLLVGTVRLHRTVLQPARDALNSTDSGTTRA